MMLLDAQRIYFLATVTKAYIVTGLETKKKKQYERRTRSLATFSILFLLKNCCYHCKRILLSSISVKNHFPPCLSCSCPVESCNAPLAGAQKTYCAVLNVTQIISTWCSLIIPVPTAPRLDGLTRSHRSLQSPTSYGISHMQYGSRAVLCCCYLCNKPYLLLYRNIPSLF